MNSMLCKTKELLGTNKAEDFNLGEDGILRCNGRIYVSQDLELKRLILEEGYKSELSLHPRMTKMYQDLEKMSTKCGYFLPINIKYSLKKLTQLYIKEIVRLDGVPLSIISDRNPRFYITLFLMFASSFRDQAKTQFSVPPANK
ncbi:hypothetical protein CR513_11443, partial [Mucuna pruriens]